MNKSLQLLLSSVLYATTAGAQAEPPANPTPEIHVRHQSGHCGSPSPQLRRLHSPEALAKALDEPTRWSPSENNSPPKWHDGSIYIQLSAGQQNQGGYRFSLNTERFDVTNKDIILHAQVTFPDPDKLHIQKVDHPCLIAEIRSPPKAIQNVRIELNLDDEIVHLNTKL